MGGADTALLDAIFDFQLDLRRFEAGTLANVMDILNRMQRELVSELANAGTLTEFNKARKAELLRRVTEVIDRYSTTAQGELFTATHGLAAVQAQQMATAMEGVVGASVGVSLPTQTVLGRLATNSLIMGGPIAEWWQKLALDTQFKVSNAIRQGIAQAETNQQIIARLIGKQGQPGIIDMARHNAAAVVQTAVQTIANDARQATFEANADIFSGYVWVTALDSHVCPLCAARADLLWDTEHKPVGHEIPWAVPPIHFNDRCVMVPRLKMAMPIGQRASDTGPVSGNTTFEDYLKRRGTVFQDEVLGPGRAELWRQGKITLQDLTSGTGRPLTLEQLRARHQ